MTGEPGKPAIGVEPAIAPIVDNPLRQIRMQRKAAPGQRRERRAVTPVAGEEPARLPRGGASEAGAFYDCRVHAATAQEKRDRRADHPTAANQPVHLFFLLD